jgi:hypothetical protein
MMKRCLSFKWCLEAWVHQHVGFKMKCWLFFKCCLDACFHHKRMVGLKWHLDVDSWTCRVCHEMMVVPHMMLFIMTLPGSLFTVSMWWLLGKMWGIVWMTRFSDSGFSMGEVRWLGIDTCSISLKFHWCWVCFWKRSCAQVSFVGTVSGDG